MVSFAGYYGSWVFFQREGKKTRKEKSTNKFLCTAEVKEVKDKIFLERPTEREESTMEDSNKKNRSK